MADALSKMRAICKALPDVTEGAHFGDVMFKVRKKPFASAGADGIVVALEPDHVDAMIASDPAVFSRYPRAKNALQIDTSKVTKWNVVTDLVHESYRLVANPKAKQPPAKKPAAAKSTAKKRTKR
jgi:hypothetical protein